MRQAATDACKVVDGLSKGAFLEDKRGMRRILGGKSCALAALRAAGDLDGKVVVDITNPLTADYMELTIGHQTSAAEEIQKDFPKARVVKAFNSVFAQVLAEACWQHFSGA